MERLCMHPLGIYIHIPFCAKKCPYCDFYSVAYHRQTAEAYVQAVIADLRGQAARIQAERGSAGLTTASVYFGGGTPSLLPPGLIAALLDAVRSSFLLLPDAEISLEANPNTISLDRLHQYRGAGINRLSFGMQSALPEELAVLGRSHSAVQVERAVCAALEAGIDNVSLDVMLGTPGQTWESVRESLAFAVSLPIRHLSAYLLKAEPGTPFWGSPLLSRCAGEEELAEIYLHTVDFLTGKGFAQYEISNFARPDAECRHNLIYWRCREYLGFGPAAHSFYQGRRFGNPRDLEAYLRNPGGNAITTDAFAGGAEEVLLLGLRLTEGVLLTDFDVLPSENRRKLLFQAASLEKAGFLSMEANRLRLTPKGFLLSNSVISALLQYYPGGKDDL